MLYPAHTPLEREVIHRGQNVSYACQGPLPRPQFIAMSGGDAHYETPSGRFTVNDDVFLLLNRNRERRMQIRSETPVDSFLIYLTPGWIRSANRFLDLSDDALLEDPTGEGRATEFFERTYPLQDSVAHRYRTIRSAVETNTFTDGWLEERLRLLIQSLLTLEHDTRKRIDSIRAVRRSTREELFRRLCRARAYAEACLSKPLSLGDLASEATMSPHHFLRTFRSVFGETPHAYVTGLRIDRARHLLTSSDLPVKLICYQVGFESPASFSSLFRRKTGQSPTHYRISASSRN